MNPRLRDVVVVRWHEPRVAWEVHYNYHSGSVDIYYMSHFQVEALSAPNTGTWTPTLPLYAYPPEGL
jgi:hypothetical protein